MPGDVDTNGVSRRDLYVVFEVDPASDSCCPLTRFTGKIEEIRQQLVDDECYIDTTLQSDECECSTEQECVEVVHTTSDIDASCPCAVFGNYECIPRLVDTRDGALRIETYVPDRDRLAALVTALKDVVDGLRLCRLKRVRSQGADDDATVTLDLYEVTEKQREAVTKAVTAGYYSSPRESSLEELAEDLDISKSALSQRLNAVESKLTTAAFSQASAD